MGSVCLYNGWMDHDGSWNSPQDFGDYGISWCAGTSFAYTSTNNLVVLQAHSKNHMGRVDFPAIHISRKGRVRSLPKARNQTGLQVGRFLKVWWVVSNIVFFSAEVTFPKNRQQIPKRQVLCRICEISEKNLGAECASTECLVLGWHRQ